MDTHHHCQDNKACHCHKEETCHCHESHGCGCGCGHDHHHESRHHDLAFLLAGASLFALGLILQILNLAPAGQIALFFAYLLLGWQVLYDAGKGLFRGRVLDENFLMSIATLGAFAIGELPEAVGIMLFYRVGEYFEQRAMARSRSQILQAMDMRPQTVCLTTGETLPAESAQPGDLILVRPGDRIPLDCVVTQGCSRVDTAPITGEPVPIAVKPGDTLSSGCINCDGVLTLRVEKPLSQSLVTRILNAVETAADSKPKIHRFLTRFSRVYTPAVVALALTTAIVPSLLDGNWSYWVYTALSFLVMSCPCALVLSIPLSYFCGIGTAGKAGILFKSGSAMEALSQVKTVVLDKTGTLTKGDFSLQRVAGHRSALPLCAACEIHSSHPIAKSILQAAEGLSLPTATNIREIPGRGICATVEGKAVVCGNEAFLESEGISCQGYEKAPWGTQVFVAAQGQCIGCLYIADSIKSDAKTALQQLEKMGLSTAMLTGDRPAGATAVAQAVGIHRVHAQLLPQEKLQRLQQLRKENGSVFFVGDGINDAVVLAGSDVGGAMGSGADAAMEAADVVFMTGKVSAIAQAIDIARKTRRIAIENVVFALGVKAIVMVLGLLGHASMWAAVFADSGVAMLCVLNALRLLYSRK